MKKINYEEKAITLVALVITIIILLILAGVTLTTALGQNGLFQKAKLAGEKYKEAEKQEQSALDDISKEIEKITIDYNNYVGAYVDYEPLIGETKISKEISGVDLEKDANNSVIENENMDKTTLEQTFKTEDDIKWQIWDYDGTTIRLISSKPTNAKLSLKNAAGYNNGIYAINEICRKCYGTGEDGVSALNIKRSDIQKVSTYDYTKYSHDENNWNEKENGDGVIKYGSTRKYTLNFKYPTLWKDFDANWAYESGVNNEEADGGIWEDEKSVTTNNYVGEGDKDTVFKESNYLHNYKNKEYEFKNPKHYELLFEFENDQVYWLVNRYVILDIDRAIFGIGRIKSIESESKCTVDGWGLYYSSRCNRFC